MLVTCLQNTKVLKIQKIEMIPRDEILKLTISPQGVNFMLRQMH